VLGLLAVVAVVVALSGAQTASAAPPSGKKSTRAVRALMERYPLRSTLFAPGTSWALSDTNFVLLGEVVRRVGGMPVERLLRRQILSRLGLRQTEMRLDSNIPPPAMHGYSRERGRYEDSTHWSPSWAPGAGNMISTLGDLGRRARPDRASASAVRAARARARSRRGRAKPDSHADRAAERSPRYAGPGERW
jgi:CubicO group peptidase (beta-lactamase class C family)